MGIRGQGMECVRRRAALSVSMNPSCSAPGEAGRGERERVSGGSAERERGRFYEKKTVPRECAHRRGRASQPVSGMPAAAILFPVKAFPCPWLAQISDHGVFLILLFVGVFRESEQQG